METTFNSVNDTIIPHHEFFRLAGSRIGAILAAHCMAGCAGDAAPNLSTRPGQKVDFRPSAR